MVTKKIKEFRFYFKPQSVVMEYRHQAVCFHSYDNPRKKPLRLFAEQIQNSRKMTLDQVYGLARHHGVNAMGVSQSSFSDVIIRSKGVATPREHSNAKILW